MTYLKIILPILILMHITVILTHLSISADCWYWSLLIMACNNTVWGSCYSAHQAVRRFAEHHIDMVSCVHRKCQTRAGVSGDINKSLEHVPITDSKFSNRVLVRMTPTSTSINFVTIWLEQLNYFLRRCKWELPDQHISVYYKICSNKTSRL